MNGTMKQEGYKFYKRFRPGLVVFQNILTGQKEVFVANKNHASWGFTWHNTDWEFCREYKD